MIKRFLVKLKRCTVWIKSKTYKANLKCKLILIFERKRIFLIKNHRQAADRKSAEVSLLGITDKWFGVAYKTLVVKSVRSLRESYYGNEYQERG